MLIDTEQTSEIKETRSDHSVCRLNSLDIRGGSSRSVGRMTSIEKTRARANRFADDRNWAQFHTPSNLLLALSGEIGEVCEIFQYKGNLDSFTWEESQTTFSKEELVHIGEEISDVMIYTTRFSDVTQIDLARAVKAKVSGAALGSPRPQNSDKEGHSSSWDTFTYQELETYATSVIRQKSSSPRYFTKKLVSYGGKLASLFIDRPESESENGGTCLETWQLRDLTDLASVLASIIVTCCCLARTVNIDVAKALEDKMTKNEKKYPVYLAKNSSAKYTSYIKKHKIADNIKMIMTGLAIGLTVGYLIRKK